MFIPSSKHVFAKEPGEVWDLARLHRIPCAEWGPVIEREVVRADGELVAVQTQKVWYEGEVYLGRPTRVFAFFSRPKGDGPFPGMVLVHGGGGTAYSVWPERWAANGYAAIAMDLSGVEIIPDVSREGDKEVRQALTDGGPPQSDEAKFSDFDVAIKEYRNRWPWQSIASIMLSHSLLDSLSFVDANRTGATGISWGGYLTSMLAGVDDRFQVVVPVYGCGNLEHSSVWTKRMKEGMTQEQRERWNEWFDPASWLPHATCRMFFVNGTDDFAYPLDIHRDCWQLVPNADVRIQIAMPHSHQAGWLPKEIIAYVDSVLRGGDPLPCLDSLLVEEKDGNITVSTKIKYGAKVTSAALCYSTDPGGFDTQNKWQIRQWKKIPATVNGESISAILPQEAKGESIRFFLEAKDSQGLTATTHFASALF